MSIALLETMDQIPPGYYIADCAVSGGRLETYLRAVMAAAQNRLCIRITPVAADFVLPCPSGQSVHLSDDALRQKTAVYPTYFSEKLGTNYLTHLDGSQLHAVLFDTEDTLRHKFRLCDRLGIPYALIQDQKLFQMLKNESAPQGGAPKRI